MQNPLKSWYNVYTINHQDSYFPSQWEVRMLVGFMIDTSTLWNDKVTRLESGRDILVG